MKKLVLLTLVIIVSLSVQAQNCIKYFPTKKGMKLEYQSFDKNKKLESTTHLTVLGSDIEDGFEVVKYKSEIKAAESDTVIESTYQIKCKDDSLTINLGDFLNQSIYEDQGFQVKITVDSFIIPTNLEVGQKLTDGQMILELVNQGSTFMTIKTYITNRKVEKKGKITTPAGTFDAVCITYDIETVVGFIRTKGHEEDWINEKYGYVKQENFDKKGNLQNSQILTNITE